MALEYLGTFPAGLTTGYRIIGAVQKQVSGALGYPGTFPAGLTASYTTIGAVQKDVSAVVAPASSTNQFLMLLGIGT